MRLNYYIKTTVALSALLVLVACGGKKVVEVKAPECSFPDDGTTAAPLWVCTESISNLTLAAVGTFDKTNAGLNFQKQQALGDARVQLAQTLRVDVTGMVKNFAETTGFGEAETVDRVASTTSKLITNQSLTGSKLYRQAKNPATGTLFVLVGMGDAELDAALEGLLNRSFDSSNNAKASWQKLQAGRSFDELKNELKENYPKN